MLEHEICPELGLEYVKLWRDECGSTLLDLIIPRHDRPCGRFVVAVSKMPSEITLGRLKCAVHASREQYHCADPWLRNRALRFVGSHEHNVCIFESSYTPTSGELKGVTADMLLLRDQKYYRCMY